MAVSYLLYQSHAAGKRFIVEISHVSVQRSSWPPTLEQPEVYDFNLEPAVSTPFYSPPLSSTLPATTSHTPQHLRLLSTAARSLSDLHATLHLVHVPTPTLLPPTSLQFICFSNKLN